MKYSAVIFDMDGTILDTIDDLADSLNHALAASGFPARTVGETRAFVGNGYKKLIERALPGAGDDERAKVLADFSEYYAGHCALKTKPYDGVEAAIKTLRAAGVKTAVVSNKGDEAAQILAKRYFPGLFDCVVGVREGIRKKPAPDAALFAAARMGVPIERCVYVGDSEVDMESARAAGVSCVSVSWGFKGRAFLEARGARQIIDSAEELPGKILEEG